MATLLNDDDWQSIVSSIKAQQCLPILGAGASYPIAPLGGDIAQAWADEHRYPFPNSRDLIAVSQYVSVRRGPSYTKNDLLRRWFTNLADPDLEPQAELHSVLADLPLPLYLTTNYDDFLTRALRRIHKNPHREMCRWNVLIEQHSSVFDDPSFELHPALPVVYHLHGHIPEPNSSVAERSACVNSLVLTEDDYLEMLLAMRKPAVIPGSVRDALIGSTLLVIGYRFTDVTFRTLFRGIRQLAGSGIFQGGYLVTLPPETDSDEKTPVATEYLERYYGQLGLKVYWGSARDFAATLQAHWKAGHH